MPAAAGLGLSTERVHHIDLLYLGAVTHQFGRSGERAEQSLSKGEGVDRHGEYNDCQLAILTVG
jgi:hypothetical protein